LLRGTPSVVFAGKSNSGKSSLINMLLNNSKLARTGQTPGLTQCVNYFDVSSSINNINKNFFFVDLPGYGYAKSGKAKTKDFSALVEAYLTDNSDIKQLFLLIDIRNGASDNDRMLVNFLNYHQVPFTVIATKADKLSKVQQFAGRRVLAGDLAIGEQNILITSSQTKQGRDDVLSLIEQKIN